MKLKNKKKKEKDMLIWKDKVLVWKEKIRDHLSI